MFYTKIGRVLAALSFGLGVALLTLGFDCSSVCWAEFVESAADGFVGNNNPVLG